MTNNSNVQLTIAFNEPGLDAEELDEEVKKLLAQMKNLDSVEEVARVLDPNPPEGNKALGRFLVGILTAEVSPANIKKLFDFLGERIGNKPIKLTVQDSDGRKINVEASSKEKFDFAMQKALDFLNKK